MIWDCEAFTGGPRVMIWVSKVFTGGSSVMIIME